MKVFQDTRSLLKIIVTERLLLSTAEVNTSDHLIPLQRSVVKLWILILIWMLQQ